MKENQIKREISQIRKDCESVYNNLSALERQFTKEKKAKTVSCCGLTIQKSKNLKIHKNQKNDSFDSFDIELDQLDPSTEQ